MSNSLPLTGIRVVDAGLRTSTAWCSRLLADYGAEVVALEPASGHPLRHQGPFDSEGISIPAQYFLVSKSIASPAELAALAEKAHVIITDSSTNIDSHQLADTYPDAVICAITPYGLTGELADFQGNDLTACAAGGWAWVNGLKDREPLKSSGYQASYQSGTFAFGMVIATLLEALAARANGQLIDISEREVLVSTSAPAPLRYQYSSFMWSRKPAVDVNEGPVPVKDGWFALTISRPAFWTRAMHVLGLPELADDPQLQQSGLRPKYKDRFVDKVGAAMLQWNRMDLFKALGDQRVIAGPAFTMDELADNPQFEARGFFRSADDGTIYPGPFARMSEIGWQNPMTAIRNTTSFQTDSPVKLQPIRAGASGKGPLSGFRGLVLTQAWAGTYATELLGLLGADIIQLETRNRLDSWRGSYQNPMPQNLPKSTAKNAWNCSALYNSVNLNKRCITVDLSEEEGVALFRELIEHADFVAENFSPRVMGNLGINYDRLKIIKPDIIVAGLSAYGAVGPWSHVPGIGGTIEPSSGMSALLGYSGEHPMNSGQMYPDPVAGLCGFAAISLALLHRDRTGEGQYIDLSMQEANFTFIGDAWMEYAVNGTVRGPLGNSHYQFAPHGIYPALGNDEWIAIGVETESQWQSLREQLSIAATYRDSADRKRNEDALNRLVAAQTVLFDKRSLEARLRAVGIPAAAVLRPDEIAEDDALRHRQHLQQVDHPETGPAWQSVLPALLKDTKLQVFHAPLQGEHSFEVFHELLGMDAATYQKLVDNEITGKGPSAKSSVANQA
jgi:crotonobetainyl-CoA:carnitine CoA-transferase CaiB-like acyl-CoA transferase